MQRYVYGGIAVLLIIVVAIVILVHGPQWSKPAIHAPAKPIAKAPAKSTVGLPVIPKEMLEGLRPGQEHLKIYKGIACFNCHNILTMDPTVTGVLFSHNKHLERGFHCGQCHGAGAHTTAIRPGHDQCFACHNGTRAPNRCILCHAEPKKIEPKSHLAATFIQTHGPTVNKTHRFADCRQCHDDQWCTECHGLRMPHPSGWKDNVYGKNAQGQKVKLAGAEHGPPARMTQMVCYRCHQPEMCATCHRTQMPHRTDYMRQHPVSMQTKNEVCSNCHTAQFCEDCHMRNRDIVHKPKVWITQHQAVARQDDQQCMVCHTRDYCDKCHKTKNPHGDDFLTRHPIYARTDPFVCNRCHTTDYCTQCHEVPHPTGWGEWHKKAGVSQRAVCLTCHKQKYCDDCHGLPMPHPSDFATQHKNVPGAALTADSKCMKCHNLDFCHTCHDKG